ncbi:MAG TPA: hypothetical protein VGQ83_32250 [Polyangia bacterium]|jgi:hypothetical protein
MRKAAVILTGALALAALLALGCGDPASVTAARVVFDLDDGVAIDQVRVQAVHAGSVLVTQAVPGQPGAPVASGADIVILFADDLGGEPVDVLVAGLRAGAQVARGSGRVTLVRAQVTPIHVRLSASPCPDAHHACTEGCYPDTDTGHCGLACTACAAPAGHGQAACELDACAVTCDTGYAPCGSDCVDLTADRAHCGSCGIACGAEQLCDGGECRANPCGLGLHPCGGGCVSDHDVATCGSRCTACATPANGYATCDGTACGVNCNAGSHACSGACASNAAVATCGTRCTPCAAPANGHATCDGAACGVACDTGYHACGATCASNLAPASCGSSCTPCYAPANGSATCDGSACGLACDDGYALCGGACLPQGQPCTAGWVQRTAAGPSPRSTQLAYDRDRGVTVLFGGYDGTTVFDDTWEWNGAAWTERTTSTAPPVRSAVAMDYDPVRHVTVLFGGADGTGVSQRDTWTWNGATWTQVATTGPAARYGAGMAWDPDEQVMLLFGGSDYGSVFTPTDFQDVWAWNGTAWSQRTPAGTPPAARGNGACFFDAARHELVVFGGSGTAGSPFGDTLSLGASGWQAETTAGPPARMEVTGVYHAQHQVGLIHGGSSGTATPQIYGDTWTWNGTTWTQLNPQNPPPGRTAHGLAYDEQRRVVVVFGGATMSGTTPVFLAETWELAY